MLMPEFGDLPNDQHLRAISTSPNYDNASGRFVNRQQVAYDKMINTDYGALLKEQIFGKQRTPKSALPVVKPDVDALLKRETLSYIWLGHSTLLMRLDPRQC